VRELLFNVTKHANTDRARLRVSTHGATLHLVVEDDGVGIDQMQHQGTGLGLDSLKRRLQLLGGHFDIGPGEEGGTRAEIRVPIAPT
jgi:signal transduction histidine kinase